MNHAQANFGASALASLLDDSTAGELIPELASHGQRQRIELVVTNVLSADRMSARKSGSASSTAIRPAR
jgi:hypothetical protein